MSDPFDALPPDLRGKLHDAGYTTKDHFPNDRNDRSWDLYVNEGEKHGLTLNLRELNQLKNALFPPLGMQFNSPIIIMFARSSCDFHLIIFAASECPG